MPTIAIVSPKGGTGKSTITECLRQALVDAQVVDLDHQQTLTILANINNTPLPVKEEETTAKYIIYDTPPYNDEEVRSLLRKADKIIVPIKGGAPDLAAFPTVYESLKATSALDKTLVVFNEIRKPITNVHKRLVELFLKNFSSIKVSTTALSNLGDFKKTLMGDKLQGDALDQIKALIQELNI